jgi:hypothetical protein
LQQSTAHVGSSAQVSTRHVEDRIGCFRVLIEHVDSLESRQHD